MRCVTQGWYFGNQIFNAIIAGKDFFREELPWSLIVYYVVFVGCSIVFIPYGPFCIAIGFIFGVYWGFLIQMGAILFSSAVLFIIGRYLFKDYVSAHPSTSSSPFPRLIPRTRINTPVQRTMCRGLHVL